MLDIRDHARIVLCRSDRLFHHLANSQFRHKSGVDTYNQSNSQQLLQDLLSDVAPSRYSHEDQVNVFSSLGVSTQSISSYSLAFMDDIFAENFSITGNVLERLFAKGVAGSYLVNQVHPFVFVSRKLACMLVNHEANIDQIVALVKPCQEQMISSSQQILQHRLTDIHVHLGGVNQPAYTILALLSLNSLPGPILSKELWPSPHIPPDFTYLRSGKLSAVRVLQILRLTYQHMMNRSNTYKVLLENNSLLSTAAWRVEDMSSNKPTETQFLWSRSNNAITLRALDMHIRIFKKQGLFVQAMLLLLVYVQFMWLISTSKADKLAVLLFIHSFNIIRSLIVMGSHTGLTNFTKYFDNPLRQLKDISVLNSDMRGSDILDKGRAIFNSGTIRVNFRITPNALAFDEAALADTVKAMDTSTISAAIANTDSISELRRALPVAAMLHNNNMDGDFPSYQFTLHFLRSASDKANTLGARDLALPSDMHKRKKVWREARKLDQWLRAISTRKRLVGTLSQSWFQNDTFSVSDRLNSKLESIDLTKLVAGIDVAGSEAGFGIEVFSPAIQFLRRDLADKSDYYGEVPVKRRLPAHIHAGEDFLHLTSGMRAIDETVTFCQFDGQDRIAHALAMGFMPSEWFASHPRILVSAEQAFDNYVWLHSKLTDTEATFAEKADSLYFLEKRIDLLAEILYNELAQEYAIDDWVSAWRLRAFCPNSILRFVAHGQKAILGDAFAKLNISNAMQTLSPSYSNLAKCANTGYVSQLSQFRERLARLTPILRARLFSPDWRRRADRILCLRYDERCQAILPPLDVIGSLEERAIHVAQDHCLARYADIGITFEACPTGNYLIAGLKNYGQHPIFRWYPPNMAQLQEGERHNSFGLRKDRVRVGVATDDPGIFNTTLVAEFKHLEKAAIEHHGCSKEAAQRWIEELKITNNNCFDCAS